MMNEQKLPQDLPPSVSPSKDDSYVDRLPTQDSRQPKTFEEAACRVRVLREKYEAGWAKLQIDVHEHDLSIFEALIAKIEEQDSRIARMEQYISNRLD